MAIRRLWGLVAVLALVVASCGTGSDGEEVDAIPPNPAGACLEGDPDCRDIPGNEPLLQDGEPDLSQEPGDDGVGFLADGGLTVPAALTSTAEGVIAVTGFIVADASGLRLCEALAESLPPQCAGAAVPLSDLDTVDPDDLRTEQGVTWSDYPVTILGEIVDGRLQATPFSS